MSTNPINGAGSTNKAYQAPSLSQKEKHELVKKLHQVIKAGKVEDIKKILDAHPTLIEEARNDKTPLLLTCEACSAKAALLLIERGANLKAKNINLSTPLHLAASRGWTEIVKAILLKDPKLIDECDARGNTALLNACNNDYPNTALVLIEHGANFKVKYNNGNTPLHQVKNNNGSTPLHLAASGGWTEVVKAILLKDPNLIDECDARGNTALLNACVSNPDTALLLIEHGANLKVKYNNGNTPLHLAAWRGWTEVVKAILLKDPKLIDECNPQGSTPLHVACLSNHDTTLLLIEHGANLKVKDNNGDTPLHLAAWRGWTEVVKAILLKDPKLIDECDAEGNTALLNACNDDHPDKALLLITHGANLKVKDNNGNTPLHLAAWRGWTEVVKAILLKDPKLIDECDAEGNTPLHIACVSNPDTALLLIEHGADLKAKDENGNLPVHLAAQFGFDEILKELIKKDPSSIDKLNSAGESALLLTLKKEKEKATLLLVKANANLKITDENGNNPLYLALYNVMEKAFAEILAKDKELLKQANNDGDTVLHLAAQSSIYENCLKDLLKRGSDLHAKNKYGQRPIHLAAHRGDEKQIKLFLKQDPSLIHKVDNEGNTLLHFASSQGAPSLIEFLIGKGVNIHAKNKQGRRPVHLAAKHSNIDALKVFVKRDSVLLHKVDEKQNTLLHLARGKETTKYLLEKKLSLKAKNSKGRIPLHTAASRNQVDFLKTLIDKDKTLIDAKDNEGYTPLARAYAKGHCQAIDYLRKKGADRSKVNPQVIHTTDKKGNTPLHHACTRGDRKIVKFLLTLSPNLKAQNHKGQTPLHVAVCLNAQAIASALLAQDPEMIDIVDNDGNSALSIAVKYNNQSFIELLLDHGADVSSISTIEHIKAMIDHAGGEAAVLEKIVDRNPALLGETDEQGKSLLHFACERGYYQVVDLFCKRGGQLKNKDSTGATPFQTALLSNRFEVAKTLLQYDPTLYLGCDNIPSDIQAFIDKMHEECTPLHLGMFAGIPLMINIKESLKALLASGPFRHTSLHLAVLLGYDQLVVDAISKHRKELLQSGLFTPNKMGQSPYFCMLANGMVEPCQSIAIHLGQDLNAAYDAFKTDPKKLNKILSLLSIEMKLIREQNAFYNLKESKSYLLQQTGVFEKIITGDLFVKALTKMIAALKSDLEASKNLEQGHKSALELSKAASNIRGLFHVVLESKQKNEKVDVEAKLKKIETTLQEVNMIAESFGSKIAAARRTSFDEQDIFSILEGIKLPGTGKKQSLLDANLEFLGCKDKDLYEKGLTEGADLKKIGIDNALRDLASVIQDAKARAPLWGMLLPILEEKLADLKKGTPKGVYEELEKKCLSLKAKINECSQSSPTDGLSEGEKSTLKLVRSWSDEVFLHALKSYMRS